MQMSVNSDDPDRVRPVSGSESVPSRKMTDLREGEAAVIERIDLQDELAHRLMELGFLPGMKVTAAHRAPGGDPRVFRVDGCEIALRTDTAAHLIVKS
jgi:Fe2+ transport system protein FeoA